MLCVCVCARLSACELVFVCVCMCECHVFVRVLFIFCVGPAEGWELFCMWLGLTNELLSPSLKPEGTFWTNWSFNARQFGPETSSMWGQRFTLASMFSLWTLSDATDVTSVRFWFKVTMYLFSLWQTQLLLLFFDSSCRGFYVSKFKCFQLCKPFSGCF